MGPNWGTNCVITVETSEVYLDWATGNQKLSFTCSIVSNFGMNFDPWDEENIQLIARELLTQAKVLTALTRED